MTHVGSPELKCFLTFVEKLKSLINGSDSGDRSGPVVQDLVCNVGCNTKPSHSGYSRPTKVVKAPSNNAA